MAILTAAEARAEIPALTGTDEDAALAVLIADVDEMFATRLGYPPATVGGSPTLEDVSMVRYYDGASVDGPTLRLGLLPIASITSIYADDNRLYSASTLIASSNYEVSGGVGCVILTPTATQGWTRGRRSIKVTAVIGYATIPPTLKRAARRMVAYLWGNRGKLAPSSSNDPTRGEIPMEILSMILPYSLPCVHDGLCGEA